MVKYYLPSILFKKLWIWFDQPYDVEAVDMVNFFSYDDVDINSFKKVSGLTSIVNLTESLDRVWDNMRKKFIRDQIKKGERNNIHIAPSKDFKDFDRLYKQFQFEKGVRAKSIKYLREHSLLLEARYSGKLIAGGVFIYDSTYARAWTLASARLHENTGQMREIIGQANRMIIWEALKIFSEKKVKYFDLGGVDNNPNSLFEFKEAFGGQKRSCFYYSKIYSRPLSYLVKIKRFMKL